MTLLFDIGNSQIKWQDSEHFDETPNTFSYSQQGFDAKLTDVLTPLTAPDADVVVVSVASGEINLAFEAWIKCNWEVGTVFLETKQKWYELKNGYEIPERLGVDRWYALVGAVERYPFPFVVCDIGTAVTVDVVDIHGDHLGGYIIPGIETMIRSLISETNITLNSPKPSKDKMEFPTDTHAAIERGCIQAIGALIDSVNEKVGDAGCCILTGGGADQIGQLLMTNSEIDRNLIFHGIKCSIEEQKV
ncbi:MAG: type III pantothenate kinase [Gammaproteobacteria bacterium]|nr:type III pantothenate kinase [Gammaproteobacteria bacterium]MCW8983508.1 type III pantothenate kinase [Gammaproteobacteria bacterium]